MERKRDDYAYIALQHAVLVSRGGEGRAKSKYVCRAVWTQQPAPRREAVMLQREGAIKLRMAEERRLGAEVERAIQATHTQSSIAVSFLPPALPSHSHS